MPSSDYQIRAQQAIDHAFLQRLYASTRTTELSAFGWEVSAINAFLQQQFLLQSRYYQDHFPNADFWLIERHDQPIGRLYLLWDQASVQLIDIALLPEQRGAGLGSRLLNELLARTDTCGLAVKLHVESHNPALRLYLRLGFGIIADKGVYLEMQRPPRSATTDRFADVTLPKLWPDQNMPLSLPSAERVAARPN
ncbi:acetyltransferase [Marinobacterium aestuarii]|uniref:Acetyltransferase n=1 Tax=Marinobacterium aestuarii TaxID=1821621 RepID=A0A1A9EXZ8_9GAMM|nr:GNAT family N-acetyltransferase [Marinobacterium aestuarii]ANG62757.1 acetyltransferase [Marinobacterium aestuarii]